MSLVPYVVEQTNRGERSYDIFSRLPQKEQRRTFLPSSLMVLPLYLLAVMILSTRPNSLASSAVIQ